MKKKVAITMGSISDASIMQGSEDILQELNIPFETFITSAHRTPERMFKFAANAKNNGFAIIIAGAGGAAHLPGMIASTTLLPVIGVPIPTIHLNGVDSLLSIVQMPGGIPVASMAIGQAKNAAIFAASILAIEDEELYNLLRKWRNKQSESVQERP